MLKYVGLKRKNPPKSEGIYKWQDNEIYTVGFTIFQSCCNVPEEFL